MNLPVSGNALFELIPQKYPFVLIDSLLEVSETSCVTSFTIPENHVLCSNGKLGAAGLIENIAQTCAAKAGFENTHAGNKIPLGFIGDVRQFKCIQRPLVNSTIKTTMVIEHVIFGATVISGKVEQDGQTIATCQMKIFVNDSEKAPTKHEAEHS